MERLVAIREGGEDRNGTISQCMRGKHGPGRQSVGLVNYWKSKEETVRNRMREM